MAASVPDGVRSRLGAVREALPQREWPVRWVRPEGIHLTLKFLGEVPAGDAGRIADALAAVTLEGAPIRLEARGIGVFPERGRPRVLWAGLGGEIERLAGLASAVEVALEPAGFPRESRPFRAHLTIGRFRGTPRGDGVAAFEGMAEADFGRFEVDGFALYESRLAPGGATYRVLRGFPLRGSEAS